VAKYKIISLTNDEVQETIEANCYTEALRIALEKQNLKVETVEE